MFKTVSSLRLEPLADLAPDFVVPGLGDVRSLANALANDVERLT